MDAKEEPRITNTYCKTKSKCKSDKLEIPLAVLNTAHIVKPETHCDSH